MDSILFLWLNGFAAKSHPFYLASWLITDYDVALFTSLYVLCCLLHRGAPGRMRRVVLLSLAAGTLTLVVGTWLGEIIIRRRPYEVLPFEQTYLLLPTNGDSSFISEYAAVAIAFAMGMWRAPSRTARWVFTALAVFIGISQIAVGFHWPSDILASALLAVGSTHLIFRWDRSRFSVQNLAAWFHRLVGRVFDR